MASFLQFLVSSLLSLLYWAIIISAVMSWLIAFDIINLRNQFVYNVHRFLDAATRPVLAPFQQAGERELRALRLAARALQRELRTGQLGAGLQHIAAGHQAVAFAPLRAILG